MTRRYRANRAPLLVPIIFILGAVSLMPRATQAELPPAPADPVSTAAGTTLDERQMAVKGVEQGHTFYCGRLFADAKKGRADVFVPAPDPSLVIVSDVLRSGAAISTTFDNEAAPGSKPKFSTDGCHSTVSLYAQDIEPAVKIDLSNGSSPSAEIVSGQDRLGLTSNEITITEQAATPSQLQDMNRVTDFMRDALTQ